jgi:putative hemolysin
MAPERIASLIAPPMNLLSRDWYGHWFGCSHRHQTCSLRSARCEPRAQEVRGDRRRDQGPDGPRAPDAGVFHASEQAIVSNVLRLDEQHISAIMTHRKDICLLDLSETDDGDSQVALPRVPTGASSSAVTVWSMMVGVLRTSDLLKGAPGRASRSQSSPLSDLPLYVPASVTTTQLLETFRRARQQCALMVDEYGELQGLVTLSDVLTSIVGDLPNWDTARRTGYRHSRRWLLAGWTAASPSNT